MTFDVQTILALISALGVGAVIQTIVKYITERKKIDGDVAKTDVDTQLAYLKTVIEQLGNEVKRVVLDRDRIQEELLEEQSRSAILRRRVRELEDEIDGVRRSARETQHKCDELATRLQQLVDDSQEN